jgi:putative ABC transport system permease protein
MRLVGRAGIGWGATGLVIGGVGSLVLGRLLASQFDVFARASLDPLAFASVGVLLGSAALAACVLPAWRASAVPPTESMR